MEVYLFNKDSREQIALLSSREFLTHFYMRHFIMTATAFQEYINPTWDMDKQMQGNSRT